ncbi:MAG: SDR family oxidoreductase [Rubellimicrobium sp.]|nr:SDR family oxidoreductase [Rubellimicrobium sp.]
MTGTLLSIGHGYVAGALGRELMARGWRVIGTTRSAGRAALLAGAGVEPLLWPGSDPGPALVAATHVLVSAPPEDGAGDPFLAAHGDLVAQRASAVRWMGYLSTTGVYGDHAGAAVDEEAECRGLGTRNLGRIRAEGEWRSVPGLPAHVFRLAGIYGPGRGPFEKLRAGTARAIEKPGHLFGRIHVEDIVQVLLASMAHPRPGRVYNVTDDEPASGPEVIAHAAALLGLPAPPVEPYAEAGMTPMARSFYQGSRRVLNGRMKRELGVRLIHPDFRAGLRAILAAEG